MTSIAEAVQWLSYTYLYIRMLRNSLAYGINTRQRMEDPLLHDLYVWSARLLNTRGAWLATLVDFAVSLACRTPRRQRSRTKLIVSAATMLDKCRMVRYHRASGNLAVTSLGRVSSHFYLQHESVETFNDMLKPHLSEAECLNVICHAQVTHHQRRGCG